MLRSLYRPSALGGLLLFVLIGLAAASPGRSTAGETSPAAADAHAPGRTAWLRLERRPAAAPSTRLHWLGGAR